MRFAKAHACGNDFLIVDDAEMAGRNYAEAARWLCARSTGVGADGVEFLTRTGERAGRILLHNADGSVAEISGNGTRCVAAWMAHESGLRVGDSVELHTGAGARTCHLERREGTYFLIRTGVGLPLVEQRTVHLADGTNVCGAAVSTGNPHYVLFVDEEDFSVADRAWQQIGAEICVHPEFSQQTNVEFVRVLAPGRIEIRIFERGVGPTSSSGTGSSASAAAAIALRGLARQVEVVAPGGAQTVLWPDSTSELLLTGPAEIIAAGECFPPAGANVA